VRQPRRLSNFAHHDSLQRGQSTVEFALVLPLFVICVIVLVSVVAASIITLRLNDFARITARSIATSQDSEEIQQDMMERCDCTIDISIDHDIVHVRATQPFSMPLFGRRISVLRLSGDSFVMKEPPVIFRAPSR
jgi:hypothetical protein